MLVLGRKPNEEIIIYHTNTNQQIQVLLADITKDRKTIELVLSSDGCFTVNEVVVEPDGNCHLGLKLNHKINICMEAKEIDTYNDEDCVVLCVCDISNRVRLGFEAQPHIQIDRKEIFEDKVGN
jgi:sRNA-binding carbon storage regulator CsrA